MIGRDFNKIKDIDLVTTLSVIIDADNVVFGLYDIDSQLISHSTFVGGRSTIDEKIDVLKSEYKGLEKICYLSKSNAFTFQKSNEESDALKKDKFTSEEVFCFYDEVGDFTKLKHMSTAMHHFHLFGDAKFLHFHIDKNIMHCLAMSEGKFIFYNVYEISTVEDFLYFSILVGDQLKMREDEDCSIYLSGNIVEDSLLFGALQPYFNNISFINPTFVKTLSGLNHNYLDHHINVLCG